MYIHQSAFEYLATVLWKRSEDTCGKNLVAFDGRHTVIGANLVQEFIWDGGEKQVR